MSFQNHINPVYFKTWIQDNHENKRLAILSFATIIISFILFKFLYPFPNFGSESDAYMEAAATNQSIHILPIGYSTFLRLFSSFSRSSTLLVLFQYLFLEISILYFLFTLKYLLPLGKWLFRILLGCCVLNPLVLQLSNLITNDALFAGLSLLWITQLLWIIYRPQLQLVLFHSLVLLSAFTTSNDALYYPIFSVCVIAFANFHLKSKIVGIVLIIVLVGGFIANTVYQYDNETGTQQYSALRGWQLAATALYGYAHASPDPAEKMPLRFRNLHDCVNQYLTSLQGVPFFFRSDHNIYNFYISDEHSPLRVYMTNKWSKDSSTPSFKRWATAGSLYADYGLFLIKKHPGAFLKYHVASNLVNFYVPPANSLSIYNSGSDTVSKMATSWFAWKNNKLFTRYNYKIILVSIYFPIVSAFINMLFILSFITFSCLGGLKSRDPHAKRLLGWILALWCSNMVLHALEGHVELRSQLFFIIVSFTFLLLLLTSIMQIKPIYHENYSSLNSTDQFI